MKSIILISLFILSFSQLTAPIAPRPYDIFSKIKKSVYLCISESTEASESLKKLVKENLDSSENLPLNFNSITLTQEDREIIRKCRREAFKATTRKPANDVVPISLENMVHRKKVALITGQKRLPRKLGMIDGIKRLTAFKVQGIFTCIEEAQPMIKVFRNTVHLWQSKDFTSSIINLYDNFETISEGLTVCINAIFPSS